MDNAASADGMSRRFAARTSFSQFCSLSLSGNVRNVDVQMTRLRRKIERDPRFPRYLQTIRGTGYTLKPD